MITIATLNAGDYEGRGAEYTNILYDSIQRNLPEDYLFKFVVFTDCHYGYAPGIEVRPLPEPGLTGWWNKLALFKGGVFPDGDQVLYLDLSCVIIGDMQPLCNYRGPLVALNDLFDRTTLQSSVMSWTAGSNNLGESDIWRSYLLRGCPQNLPRGDQEFIQSTVGDRTARWQDLLPGAVQSYKVSMGAIMIPDASVVVFHGTPKPHECGGWVKKVWQVGGMSWAGVSIERSREQDLLRLHQEHFGRASSWVNLLEWSKERKFTVIGIIGAGKHKGYTQPDYLTHLEEIKATPKNVEIWAVNEARDLLMEQGVTPHVHVIVEGFKTYKRVEGLRYYVADFAPPDQFAQLLDCDVTAFHVSLPDDECTGAAIPIQPVCAVAMAVARILGYDPRKMMSMGMC